MTDETGRQVDSEHSEDPTDASDNAARTGLGLFAAAVAFLLPTAFLPSVAAPFWVPKMAIVVILAAVGTAILCARPASTLRSATWAARSFLAIAVASTVASSNPDLAFVGLWNQGTGLIFVAACVGAWAIGVRLNAVDQALVVRALLIAIGINVLAVVSEMAFDLTAFGLGRFLGRAPGLLQSPVFLGPFLAAGIALVIPWLARSRQRPAALVLIPIGLAVGLSGGRAAALLVVLLAAWAWRHFSWRTAATVVLLVVAGFALGPGVDRPPPPRPGAGSVDLTVPALPAAEGGGPTLLESRPLSPRLTTWWSARHAISDSPLIGSGPGQFRAATIRYRPVEVSEDTPDRYFTDAHNFVVEHAVTTGLMGLAALLAWLSLAAVHARGSLGVFAAALGVAHLFQPENVGTTPIALLALGCAASSACAEWRVPTGVALSSLALASIAAVAAALLVYGAAALRVANLDFTLGKAEDADAVLRPWPQAVARQGVIHQYSWATGDPSAAGAARAALLEAARREPDSPLRWVVLAEVAASHGDLRLARHAANHALALDPRSTLATAVAERLGPPAPSERSSPSRP